MENKGNLNVKQPKDAKSRFLQLMVPKTDKKSERYLKKFFVQPNTIRIRVVVKDMHSSYISKMTV